MKALPVLFLILFTLPFGAMAQEEQEKTAVEPRSGFGSANPSLQQAADEKPGLADIEKPDRVIYQRVDQKALFPGCEKEIDAEKRALCAATKMQDWLQSRLKYPKAAVRKNIQGEVVVECIVDRFGNLSEPRLLEPLEGGCSEEALRLIGEMTKSVVWLPAKLRGMSVPSYVEIPVEFALPDK